MHPGTPIPVSAFFHDPLWLGRFIDLANELVLMNAKPKIIARYTGLQSKAIATRYLRLNNTIAKKGRLKLASSRSFAAVHKRWGYDWNIQAATFASICLKIERSFDFPLNRGWLLATAYKTYLSLTEGMMKPLPTLNRLTFDDAYDLMNHFLPDRAGLALHECNDCGTNYLVITEAELDGQNCPMCSMQQRFVNLLQNVEKITALRNQKRSGE
jgi:hypothetical protein